MEDYSDISLKQLKLYISEFGKIPKSGEVPRKIYVPTIHHHNTWITALHKIGLPYHRQTKQGNFHKCPMCGEFFLKVNSKKMYCTPNCRDRFKQWKYRVLREAKGLCTQCGKPMIEPKETHRGLPKHCHDCQEKFKNYHKERL